MKDTERGTEEEGRRREDRMEEKKKTGGIKVIRKKVGFMKLNMYSLREG